MRIAVVEMQDGTGTVAVQDEEGRLLRADGDLTTGEVAVSDEVVEPRRWLPPVSPRTIMCIGRNYAVHAAEGGARAGKPGHSLPRRLFGGRAPRDGAAVA